MLPGNSWVYRVDEYEHSLWRGYVFTETVESGTLLASDVYLATLAYEQRSLTGTSQPQSWWDDRALREKRIAGDRGYAFLWRGELYRTQSSATVAEWLDYFLSPGPIPTIAPMYDYLHHQPDRPAPYLTLPVGDGFIAPVVVIGANWDVEGHLARVETAAGSFKDCVRAFHPGNYNGWRWFCHGVGDVRFEYVKGGSTNIWSIEELVGVRIEAEVRGESARD